jgi:hypothetical protein
MESLRIGGDDAYTVQLIWIESCDDDICILFVAFADDGAVELDEMF